MIRIICLGKIKEQYLIDAINDYYKRISKYHKIEIIELKDDENILNEENQILKYLDSHDLNIALCIEGKEFTSVDLAELLDKGFVYNSKINFIIGSSNGLSDTVKRKCNINLSFGKVTMPHGLFRVVLLEQIYRSFKIINDETYHK